MAVADDFPLTEFDKKAMTLLGDKAVVKSLATGAALARLPRNIFEYLVTKFVNSDS
jgi:hypothetical protein